MPSFLLALAIAVSPADTDTSYVYRTLLIRAAPGQLAALSDLYVARGAVMEAAGDGRPWIMRHRQGDQWDLMLLFPMGTFSDFHSPARIARRGRAATASGMSDAEFEALAASMTAWREELFVAGPPPDVVGPILGGGALYHIEMFIALPDKRSELWRQREMENAFLAAIDRPQNLIFTRVAGAAWDLYTLGVHADLPSFAAGDTISIEREEVAAREAGFESVGTIGTYLRSLIQRHHDTLARPVR